MRSLFSSRYLGRNGCQADYEKLKITSKRKTIGDFHITSLKFITKLSNDPPEILLSCIRAVENRSISPRDMLLLKTNIHTNVRTEWVLGFVMSCWLKMWLISGNLTYVAREINSRYRSKSQWQTFLLICDRHVGAHLNVLQHGVSIQISINLGKEFLCISDLRWLWSHRTYLA